MIYLDWAAAAPPAPEVIAAMAEAAEEYFGNPSAAHFEGKKARTALDGARARCARFLGCRDEQLIFTSGGTESNAIVFLSRLLIREPGTIILSGLEHPSVSEPIQMLQSRGWTVKVLHPGKDGIIQPEKLARMLEKYPDTRLVTVMGVSNEIGTIQPIDELTAAVKMAREGKKRPIHFHADLVQAAGKIPLNLASGGFDTAAFSAHKFRGPKGMGLLYHRSRHFEALIRGGGQEFGIRPGTENVAGAAAMALALERYGRASQGVRENGEWLLRRLLELPGARIIPENRHPDGNQCYVPGIIAAAFPPMPGEVLTRILAESGYAVSTGSACRSNKKGKLPSSLISLDLPRNVAAGMIRISLGPDTMREELEGFIETLGIILKRGY